MTKFRKQAIIQSFQSIWLCCIDDKVVLVNEYLSSEVSIGFWIGGGGGGEKKKKREKYKKNGKNF